MLKKIGLFVVLMGIVGAFFFRDKIQLAWFATRTTENRRAVSFFIKEKVDLQQLSHMLVDQGFVSSAKSILVIGAYKKLTSDRIALGKYVIAPKTSIRNLLNGFTLNSGGNGNAEVEVDVVVPNVRFLTDLAGKLAEKTMVDSASFIALLENESTLAKFGFTKEEFPAMFIPNTYKMYYDTDGHAFLARMAKEFKNYWTLERKEKLTKIGLRTPSEAVTLASIVYSEQSRKPEEWPVIAGLYLNRIRQGIPLQSDPTFKFCWGKELDTVQRLLNVHRNIQCPYNTYQIKGLPPGPICIPPIGVVTSVLNPDQHNYVFMCAEPSYSGLHNFAQDYTTHASNARKFQVWLARELAKNK